MRGFAHIQFQSAETAAKAVELNGQQYDGRPLRIDLSGNKPARNRNQGGYNQGGYKQGGYNQGGYNQGGY